MGELLNECMQKGVSLEWITRGITIFNNEGQRKWGCSFQHSGNYASPANMEVINRNVSGRDLQTPGKTKLHTLRIKRMWERVKKYQDCYCGKKYKLILRNRKRRQTGLVMEWIDYKKAYRMVTHSWILNCMDESC